MSFFESICTTKLSLFHFIMDSRIIFFISFAVIYAECSRILVIPVQGKSHMIATNAIGQELKKNGHEVGSDLYYL